MFLWSHMVLDFVLLFLWNHDFHTKKYLIAQITGQKFSPDCPSAELWELSLLRNCLCEATFVAGLTVQSGHPVFALWKNFSDKMFLCQPQKQTVRLCCHICSPSVCLLCRCDIVTVLLSGQLIEPRLTVVWSWSFSVWLHLFALQIVHGVHDLKVRLYLQPACVTDKLPKNCIHISPWAVACSFSGYIGRELKQKQSSLALSYEGRHPKQQLHPPVPVMSTLRTVSVHVEIASSKVNHWKRKKLSCQRMKETWDIL